MLVASLRDVIRAQAAEIEKLQVQLKSLSGASSEVRPYYACVITMLTLNLPHVHLSQLE